MNNDSRVAPAIIWGSFIVFCLIWLCMLGARTLVPTDEGRYAEMAREMLATGDWITPRLDAIKYFEKPPLQIWATALAFKLFGLGEWQARLWTGLCGLFGIVLTAYAGCRVFTRRIGLIAGIVLASCLLWDALGHINTLDMGLAAMMALALCGLLIAQREDAQAAERCRWMLACWAGTALAVLSKGLIGIVLPGAVLVLYTAISRDWAIWKRLYLVRGLILFFAITAPWFVLVSARNPEFPHFFFIHEHFERFTTKVHHRYGPWYYFIPILLLGVMPWLGAFAQSLWQRDRSERGFRPMTLLLVWAVFIFFFFSISDSKLPSYILPIFPALALLLAVRLDAASRATWRTTALVVLLAGLAVLAAGIYLPHMSPDAVEIPLYAAARPWVIAAALALVAGSAASLRLTRAGDAPAPLQSALALGWAGFLAVQLLMIGSEPYGRVRSGAPLVPAILAELTPATPLYAVGMYDQTLPFYLRRTMTLVQHPDELEFGLEQQPQLWLPTRAEFVEKWLHGQRSVAVMPPEIFAEFKRSGMPMRVIARDERRVVITNDQSNQPERRQ